MNRRTIITVLTLIAFIAFVVWIARNTYWVEENVRRPLTGEAARNPFYAAERLVEKLDAHAETMHELQTLPPNGVLLLAGWNWNLIGSRRDKIQHWVEAGGRLVLDRDLIVSDDVLQHWSGLSRLRVKPGGKVVERIDDESGEADEHGCGRVNVAHDTDGVSRYRQQYEVCTMPVLKAIASERDPLWALRDDEGFQAVRVRVGQGSVTWLDAQPFQYRDVLQGDHALLFVAAMQLRPGDHVVFMSEEDQPSLLALIWRHGWPIVLLFALWVALMLWRSGVRFGPAAPVTVPARRSLAEQIKGTSEFTRRHGGGTALHAAEVRALHEAAQKHIPRFRSMTADERLAVLARMTNIEAERLGETLNYAGPRKPLALKRALELIEAARRRLVATQIKKAGEETVHVD